MAIKYCGIISIKILELIAVKSVFTRRIRQESFLAEITREAVLKYINQEIRYQINIITDKMVKSLHYTVHQKIVVNTISHKKIILGKNGHSIKSIGIYARSEMEKVFKCKVNLFLKVLLKKK